MNYLIRKPRSNVDAFTISALRTHAEESFFKPLLRRLGKAKARRANVAIPKQLRQPGRLPDVDGKHSFNNMNALTIVHINYWRSHCSLVHGTGS